MFVLCVFLGKEFANVADQKELHLRSFDAGNVTIFPSICGIYAVSSTLNILLVEKIACVPDENKSYIGFELCIVITCYTRTRVTNP